MVKLQEFKVKWFVFSPKSEKKKLKNKKEFQTSMVGIRSFLFMIALIVAASAVSPVPTSSPDQSAMLRFVSGWTGPKCSYNYPWNTGCISPTWTADKPVCSWMGVTCDASGRVTSFIWPGYNNGALQQCSGSFKASDLPEGIRTVDLSNNRFTGAVDFTGLPANVLTLRLNNNTFTGNLTDFTKLPGGVQYLYLGGNSLSGVPDLTALPGGMQELWLNNNKFTGVPNLTKLPLYIPVVDISYNLFCGGSTPTDVGCIQLGLDPKTTCVGSVVTFPPC